MKIIEIESENLIVKGNENKGITALAKGGKVDIVILWNILTDIIVKDKGGKEMLESYLQMEVNERKQAVIAMSTAYRISRNMNEFRELMERIQEKWIKKKFIKKQTK